MRKRGGEYKDIFFIPDDCRKEEVKEIAIKLLKHIISKKEPISYKDLSLKLSPNSLFYNRPRNIEEPLGRISYACKDNGLPPISVMVINKEKNMPGAGFFEAYCSEIKGKEAQTIEAIKLMNRVIAYESWNGVLEAFNNIR